MREIAYASGHGDAGVTFGRSWVVRGFLIVVDVAMLAVGMAMSYGLYLSASLALPAGDEHPPRLIYGAPFLPSRIWTSPRRISSNVFISWGIARSTGQWPNPVIIG